MSKLKRPEKIQTSMSAVNGPLSGTSSPSLSAKRPPSAILPPNSASANGLGMSNGASRTANRPRRDAPGQLLGRGQRNSSVGLRSASIAADSAVAHVSQPQPYIQSDTHILQKYRGCDPSLVVHLHPTHFRFDQQDGTFTYKSPMKIFIEHLRSRTVPHDLMDYFTLWNITFYEGCLIVEVHDHKSVASAKESSHTSTSSEKTEPFSIHHYNNYLTPSPWVPYPKESLSGLARNGAVAGKSSDDISQLKSAAEKDKENMPAPGQPSDQSRSKGMKKAKVCTIVLHPTPLSTHMDIVLKASTPMPTPMSARRESRHDLNIAMPLSASGLRPQTPMIAIPSTPHLGMDPPPLKRVRRERMELDGKTVYTAQEKITLATTATLSLEPVDGPEASVRLLESLEHPEHAAAVPSPKTRKKTVAEMAAEESAAADVEKFMLVLDERYSSGAPGGANPVDGDGKGGGASFEPRFERFKAIETIKIQNIENKRKEKIQQAEAAKRQQQEQERESKARAEALKRQQESESAERQARQLQQQQAHQHAQFQENRRRQMAAQAQQAQQNMQAAQSPMGQAQGPHGHPQQNMQNMPSMPNMSNMPNIPSMPNMSNMPNMQAVPNMQSIPNMQNGITPQQRGYLQGQHISQAQASSPIVRNATPQNLSSPMVATNLQGAPMQQSTSNMGGSPPRPGSVVQNGHQMNQAMSQAMRPQESQQSHGGTPRPMNATPNLPQAVPRQVSQTPRMSATMTQASPIPGHMVQMPQMGAQMMPNGQMINAQMQAISIAQQQQAQQRIRQQAAAQATQQRYMMQQQMQQMAQQQPNNGMLTGGQMASAYAAQMQAMAAAQGGMVPNVMQQMQPGGMQQQMANPNYMANQMNAHMAQGQENQMNVLQRQIANLAQRHLQNGMQALLQQWNGAVPPQVLAQYKAQCHQRAQQAVMKNVQQQQHQMRLMQQNMAQGMGGNMNGMMQRPPGM